MHGTGKGHVDPSRVVVSGRGLEDGVLATFDSSFTVDTRGAGPGQLNCKMKGKKGEAIFFGWISSELILYDLIKSFV